MKKFEISANITDIALVHGKVICKLELKTDKETIWFKWIDYNEVDNKSKLVAEARGKSK